MLTVSCPKTIVPEWLADLRSGLYIPLIFWGKKYYGNHLRFSKQNYPVRYLGTMPKTKFQT